LLRSTSLAGLRITASLNSQTSASTNRPRPLSMASINSFTSLSDRRSGWADATPATPRVSAISHASRLMFTPPAPEMLPAKRRRPLGGLRGERPGFANPLKQGRIRGFGSWRHAALYSRRPGAAHLQAGGSRPDRRLPDVGPREEARRRE